MKYLNLTFIVLGLLVGCNQTNSKKKLVTGDKSVDTTNSRAIRQKTLTNNEKLEQYKIDSINNVIALFKEKNIDKISIKISFPLHREHPIPPIKNKKEFRQRFNEVFDNILIDKIANSKIDQWSEAGWRGIMLDAGVVWIGNSYDKITAINYQSDFEKKLKEDLIGKDKDNLHISLRTFESSTYRIKTKNYLIRVDKLTNHKYRYASWKVSEKESSKPDIILDSGELEYQGSSGNQIISFLNNNYTYRVYRNFIGTVDSESDITLEVEKDGQIILTQNGTLYK